MPEEKKQITFGFIDDRDPWEAEWENMPEYLQEDQSPYRTIYVHFKCKEDVEDFEKKIGQKIYPVEKTYWHPKADIKIAYNKRYVDENSDLEEDTRKCHLCDKPTVNKYCENIDCAIYQEDQGLFNES